MIDTFSWLYADACLECTCAMDTYAADEQESQAQTKPAKLIKIET